MRRLPSFHFIITIVFLITSFASHAQHPDQVIKKNNQYYLSNTIIIKLKEKPFLKQNNTVLLNKELMQSLSGVGLISSNGLFTPTGTNNEDGLDKITVVKFSSEIDPQILASKIRGLSDVEWAEPKYVYPVEFVPNDPSFSSQYALAKIKAQEAWDITHGDTSIVLAIIDTGVDWDHPDLQANIWNNGAEIPNNGFDDDHNGYVDDVRGWDFGGLNGIPDNNPMEDRPDHGTHVAGDASAVTNNSTGIASIGFNSKIMPVKTSRDDFRSTSGPPFIVYGYEGIKYAAENGAKIINCSWGGGGYSMLGQEIINYATSLGALVVAAAGNNNSSTQFYPASYKNVLSVAATDESDLRASFSNYGSGVDVSAPGVNIYSTWQNNTYTFGSGTSFSSPIAAGVAALVKARFPSYTPNQIAEQIRINCDDINSINPGYVNQLGRGRVNAFKSLNNLSSISARAIDVKFLDDLPGGNGDGVLQPGETIRVKCQFVNYLNPTANLSVFLESSNNYSTVQNGTLIAGTKATLDTFDNNSSIFTFELSQNVPQNAILTFNINYLDAGYIDFQSISVTANPTYATQAGNDVALTFTSKGALGFNDYPNNTQGEGFKYLDSPNHLFEGALMLATSSNNVSDCARGSSNSLQNTDFTSRQPFILSAPGDFADVEGNCVFNDSAAGSNMIGIQAQLHSYSFNDSENKNYILLKYSLKNTTSAEINNLYAGLFFDWDMIDGNDDFAAYDSVGNLGYCYHVGSNTTTWVASALVSSDNYGFWAINNQGGDGGFNIYDGFSDSEKWLSLSSGIGKTQAGAGDVSYVVSGGPHSIRPDETIQIAFAIAAGFNIDELRTAVANSRNKYSQIPTAVKDKELKIPGKFYLDQNFPNPFNPSTTLRYSIPYVIASETKQSSFVTLRVYDVLGRVVETIVNDEKPAGSYEVEFDASNLPSGVYFYQLRAGNFTQTKKMMLLH